MIQKIQRVHAPTPVRKSKQGHQDSNQNQQEQKRFSQFLEEEIDKKTDETSAKETTDTPQLTSDLLEIYQEEISLVKTLKR